ncbi:MAG: leucine-rich repeat domain-containing protein [Ruminococcus sp.]|nr:leucine-rich repeat domain-containing protein [Ruminococcus sp.]HRR75259.1 leucine-rich repeat domain-containing protein [Ruminococcus sp.]
MKRSIKAIIATAGAAFMCAVPTVSTIADTTLTNNITASAASYAPGIPMANVYSNGAQGKIFVTKEDGLLYKMTSEGNGKWEVAFCGVASMQPKAVVDNKINVGGVIYNVTSIVDDGFKNRPNARLDEFDFSKATQITEIPNGAFSNCSIESIVLPPNLTTVGNEAFMNSTWLTSITIPEYVTSVGTKAFKGCKRLKTIRFERPATSYRALTLHNEAFANCTGLTSITNNVTRFTGSASDAFNGVTKSNVTVGTTYRIIGWKEQFINNFKRTFNF